MKLNKTLLLSATILSGFAYISSAKADFITYTTDEDLGSQYVLENYNEQKKTDNTVVFVKGATVTVGDNSVIKGNKADIGGAFAVSSTEGSLLKIGAETVFSNNEAYFDGGAIGNYGGAIIAENVTFENNVAQIGFAEDTNSIGGGAMSLGAASETTIAKGIFNSNTSGYNGGAIGTRRAKNDNSTSLNDNRGSLTITDSTFSGNTASNTVTTNAKGQLIAGHGGAIYNSLKATISNTDFASNSATNNGGAIYNAGDTDLNGRQGNMTITGGTFKENHADNYGGAIFNGGSMSISGTTFDSNTALYAGALSTGTVSSKMEITDVVFSNNSADELGAVGLFGQNSTLTNVTFSSNTATSTASNSDGAGALFLGAVSKTVLDNVTFEGNSSQARGGAIATRSSDLGNNKDAKLDILNSTFKNNTAAANGGAFDNFFYSSKQNDTAVYIDNTTFETNSAKNGGAIYNHGEQGVSTNYASLIVSNATFTDNKASADGGAIYNSGGMTFEGVNTFSANNDASGLNDIYNYGSIAVANGAELQLDGGISGTGSIVFDAGSTLQVNATTTKISNTVTTNAANLNMVFANAFEGEYELVTGSVTDADFTIGANSLYDIVGKEGVLGTYVISKKSTEEIAENTGADSTQSAALDAVMSGSSDTNEQFNEAANNIVSLLQNNDTKAEGLEALSAMSVEAAPLVRATQTNHTSQVFSVVSTRLSGGSVGAAEGKSSGDTYDDSAMWVQGLINQTKLDGQFDTDTHGLAFGVEKQVNDEVKVGIAYALAKTDVDSYSRDTQIKTHSAMLYGEYKPSNWFVNGILSYSMSDYEEDKTVAGVNAEADYDANNISIQAVTGYEYVVNNYYVTPTIGLRYMNIDRDGYTDALGTNVDSNRMDILTAMLGVKFETDYTVNDWTFTPEVRAAVTYDLIHDDDNALVTLANGAAYSVDTDNLKRFGYELGAGVKTYVNDEWELGIGYEGKFRQDYQDHTGLISAKYHF